MTEYNRDEIKQNDATDHKNNAARRKEEADHEPQPAQDEKPVSGDTIAEMGDKVGGPA